MKMRYRQAGFSLVEVMVALVVCAVGLLGLAKMTSLSIASEDVAGTRTMAALEASSLAAMMHADRSYWSSASATTNTVVTWNVTSAAPKIVDANGALNVTAVCTTPWPGATCTPIQMAAYDVAKWGTTLNSLLPGFTATLICTQPVTVGPVTCTVTINWVERAVGLDNNQVTQLAAKQLATPSYTLYVQP